MRICQVARLLIVSYVAKLAKFFLQYTRIELTQSLYEIYLSGFSDRLDFLNALVEIWSAVQTHFLTSNDETWILKFGLDSNFFLMLTCVDIMALN